MSEEEFSRKKQVLIAASILGTIMFLAVSLIMGWRMVPGLLGEWLGVLAGLISTPFFLEGSFFVMGILIVTSLNSWRRAKEGDEFVYLEQVDGPDVPADLPDHAKWAIYSGQPLPAGTVTALEQAEGALAIGDHQSASAAISTLGKEELSTPGVLRVRLALAEAAGKSDLAGRLREELGRTGNPT